MSTIGSTRGRRHAPPRDDRVAAWYLVPLATGVAFASVLNLEIW